MKVLEFKVPAADNFSQAAAMFRGFFEFGVPVAFWLPTQIEKSVFLKANHWAPADAVVSGQAIAGKPVEVFIICGGSRVTEEGDVVKLASQRVQTFTNGAVYVFSDIEIGANSMDEKSIFSADGVKMAGGILQGVCHGASAAAGWWVDVETGKDLVEELRAGTRLGKALAAEKLCLAHSELSEAMEGHRKCLPDDKLPHRPMMEVELADAVIRIFDLAGAMGYDLGGAIAEKMAFNAQRADHKLENRQKAGGKAY